MLAFDIDHEINKLFLDFCFVFNYFNYLTNGI